MSANVVTGHRQRGLPRQVLFVNPFNCPTLSQFPMQHPIKLNKTEKKKIKNRTAGALLKPLLHVLPPAKSGLPPPQPPMPFAQTGPWVAPCRMFELSELGLNTKKEKNAQFSYVIDDPFDRR